MCSYPIQKSDIVSKRNNISPFISHVSNVSDLSDTNHDDPSGLSNRSVMKELFYICAVQAGSH